MVKVEHHLSDFETLMASTQLPIVGSFISLLDWYSIRNTSKSCKESVDQWMTEDMSASVENFIGAKVPRFLTFGNHNINKKRCNTDLFSLPALSASLFRNPTPILQFSLNSLGYDATKRKIIGKHWSELRINKESPTPELGRNNPNVIVSNDIGDKIFYCGGRCVAKNDGRWLQFDGDMSQLTSSTTAYFNVVTASWTLLPPMPDARSNAGVCRVGTQIFIIGGEKEDNHDSLSYSRSILCFDTAMEEWLDTGMPHFPGEAYAGFAVVAEANGHIFVAGGNLITEDHPTYGALIGTSREVFSLDITSKKWTRLPDIPGNIARNGLVRDSTCQGFLIKDPQNNGCDCMYPAVNIGKRSIYLVNDSNESVWKEVSEKQQQSGSIVGFAGGRMVASLGSYTSELYDTELKEWQKFPQEDNDSVSKILNLVDSNGDDCSMCGLNNSTTVAISSLVHHQ